MKIIKLAAGVPNGYTTVEVTIKKDGTIESKYIRDGKSVCSPGDGKALEDLTKYLTGGFSDLEDATKNSDWYEQNRVKESPIPAAPETEEMPARPEAPQREREFGV